MNYKYLFITLCASTIYAITQPNPAFHAIAQDNPEALKKILRQNPASNQTNEKGQTILHAAVLTGNWKTVKIILKSGFRKINQLDNTGKTAMDYAVEYGYDSMIKKLYEKNGKVTSPENATYAKNIITHSFKSLFISAISFFLGAALLICINLANLCFSESCMPIAEMLGLSFSSISIGILFLIISKSGWTSRAGHNLLLPKSGQVVKI